MGNLVGSLAFSSSPAGLTPLRSFLAGFALWLCYRSLVAFGSSAAHNRLQTVAAQRERGGVGVASPCQGSIAALVAIMKLPFSQLSVRSTLSSQHTRINLPARKEIEEVVTQKRSKTPKLIDCGGSGRAIRTRSAMLATAGIYVCKHKSKAQPHDVAPDSVVTPYLLYRDRR